jgi:hypothetical protein
VERSAPPCLHIYFGILLLKVYLLTATCAPCARASTNARDALLWHLCHLTWSLSLPASDRRLALDPAANGAPLISPSRLPNPESLHPHSTKPIRIPPSELLLRKANARVLTPWTRRFRASGYGRSRRMTRRQWLLVRLLERYKYEHHATARPGAFSRPLMPTAPRPQTCTTARVTSSKRNPFGASSPSVIPPDSYIGST